MHCSVGTNISPCGTLYADSYNGKMSVHSNLTTFRMYMMEHIGSPTNFGDQHFCPDGKLYHNFALILCGDGVSPFKRKSYSMLPVALACANLPAHLRRTLPATWLPCIVPAQGHKKSEPGDFRPFLR